MKKKIMIVGGGLQNKGAQAMSFIVIDELKKRYPEAEMVLCSYQDIKQTEADKYNFTIIPIDTACLFYYSKVLSKLVSLMTGKKDSRIAEKYALYMKETIMAIDISGYQLASVWSIGGVMSYLLRIKGFKRKQIPVYIMPQSFGPLNYPKPLQKVVDYYIKKYMTYPEVVYAREKDGYELLTGKYKLKNVQYSPDMVLINKDINSANIYIEEINNEVVIVPNSVAIIPNLRLVEKSQSDKILQAYQKMVNYLLEHGKTVYLLRHSTEDLKICQMIKKMFDNNENVILIENEFDCQEYSKIVKKFNFLIASRYHSIVHAYREGVPCLILGWASKYHELACLLGQERYLLNMYDEENDSDLITKMDYLAGHYKQETEVIKNSIEKMKEQNRIFEVFNKNKGLL